MTILILDSDQIKIAEMLDDKHLDKMIKSIIQVLCNTHWINPLNLRDKSLRPPLQTESFYWNKWNEWSSRCIANYRYLVELGLELCREYAIRFSKNVIDLNTGYINSKNIKEHKYQKIIGWSRDNEPNLPDNSVTIIPEPYNPHNCPDIHKWKKQIKTPFPFVMPKKIQKIYPLLLVKYLHDENTNAQVIYWYRNYYKHLIEKIESKDCKECFGHGSHNPGACSDEDCCGAGDYTCDICKGSGKNKLTWTIREKPEFLK